MADRLGRNERRSHAPGDDVTRRSEGFTLVEALVALFIMAVVASGLVRAVQAHIDIIRGSELRVAAGWVAENRLAELTAGAVRAEGGASDVTMLDRRWRVEQTLRDTPDAELAAVEVRVFAEGDDAPLATLGGFVDTGAPA